MYRLRREKSRRTLATRKRAGFVRVRRDADHGGTATLVCLYPFPGRLPERRRGHPPRSEPRPVAEDRRVRREGAIHGLGVSHRAFAGARLFQETTARTACASR